MPTELEKEINFARAVAKVYNIPLTEEEIERVAKLHRKMWETNHLGYRDEILRARAWNEEYNRQQALKKEQEEG